MKLKKGIISTFILAFLSISFLQGMSRQGQKAQLQEKSDIRKLLDLLKDVGQKNEYINYIKGTPIGKNLFSAWEAFDPSVVKNLEDFLQNKKSLLKIGGSLSSIKRTMNWLLKDQEETSGMTFLSFDKKMSDAAGKFLLTVKNIKSITENLIKKAIDLSSKYIKPSDGSSKEKILELSDYYKSNPQSALDLLNEFPIFVGYNRISIDQPLWIEKDDISKINLKDNKITTIPKDAFKGFTKLRILNLQGNPIKEIEAGAFNGQKLYSLTLSIESKDDFKILDQLLNEIAQSRIHIQKLLVDLPQSLKNEIVVEGYGALGKLEDTYQEKFKKVGTAFGFI